MRKARAKDAKSIHAMRSISLIAPLKNVLKIARMLLKLSRRRSMYVTRKPCRNAFQASSASALKLMTGFSLASHTTTRNARRMRSMKSVDQNQLSISRAQGSHIDFMAGFVCVAHLLQCAMNHHSRLMNSLKKPANRRDQQAGYQGGGALLSPPTVSRPHQARTTSSSTSKTREERNTSNTRLSHRQYMTPCTGNFVNTWLYPHCVSAMKMSTSRMFASRTTFVSTS
mmetsp:Transcript_53732/g.151355  ORF Transcript_53732/g.151355 Transcript_53732/m.151355 type:complete len:227 (+) Transcript_53732:633-1313(+)